MVDMCLLLGVASALSSMVGVGGRFDNLQVCDICHRSWGWERVWCTVRWVLPSTTTQRGKTVAKKKKYTVKFSIDFCGDYGTKEVIAYEEPDMHELWDMALEHFQPEAEVIDEEELEEGDEGYEEEDA